MSWLFAGFWPVLLPRLVGRQGNDSRADQRGLITEVRPADGSPPYVVRWLATGHVAVMIPGADAVVVTPAEMEAADERMRSRSASVETAVAHHTKSE